MSTPDTFQCREIGPTLLPFQVRWVLDRSPRKLSVKSRQIGITWSTAYEAVEVASAEKSAGGSDFWYQTYAEEDAKEFIIDCAFWAEHFHQTVEISEQTFEGQEASEHFILPEGKKSVKVTTITLRSGFRITILPHSPRKLRGKRGVYCLDEAAQHEDFEGVMKACGAFEVWGGRIIIISTVTDAENPWWKYVEKVEAGKVPGATLHTTTIHDAVADGLYRRVCLVKGWEWTQKAEDEWVAQLLSREGSDQEFKCLPLLMGKKYIPKAMVIPCLYDAPVYRFYRPDTWFTDVSEDDREVEIREWFESTVDTSGLTSFPHFLGVDFGRSSDLSVFVPGYEDQQLDLWVPFVIELGNVPFENQKHLTEVLIDSLPMFSGASFDKTGNGVFLAEWALGHYGELLVECINITLPWYHEHFPALRTRYEERTIHHPKDIDHVADTSIAEVIDGKPFIPRKRVKAQREDAGKEKRHGDFLIGALMLSHASLRDPETYDEYESVPGNDGKFAREGVW